MITSAVKASGPLSLSVLGLPYGADRDGQIFTPDTDVELRPGDKIPVYYWHGYAERRATKAGKIGSATYRGPNSDGHWFDVALDATHPRAEKIHADAAKGLARASSDSASHLVRPGVAVPGPVTYWPLFALSLMDSETAGTAINPRAVAYAAAKAFLEDAEIGMGGLPEDSGEVDAVKAGAKVAKRNQDRILRIAEAVKALTDALDEIKDEFETATTEDANGGSGPLESPAVKGEIVTMTQENTAALDAVKAEMDAKLESAIAELKRTGFVKADTKTDAPAAKADGVDAAKAYADAFDHYVRTGERSEIRVAAKAAMNETTAAQGAYLVPTKYATEILKAIAEASILRAAGARVLTVSGTKSFKVPTLTNTTAAVLVAEAADFDQQEPTLGEVEFNPYKYTRLSLASDELLADSAFDVFGQILSQDAVEAFQQAENTAFVTGTGSGQPQGLAVGSSLGKTAAATNAITSDEVIDLYHSLATQYRGRGAWFMKDSTLAMIRKLRENGSTGAYLWQPAISAGEPATLMGRPVYVVSTMPAATTGLKPIVFADPSYFWIADFSGIDFKRLEELYAKSGQVGFRWYKRFDSNVMLSAAVKHLIMA